MPKTVDTRRLNSCLLSWPVRSSLKVVMYAMYVNTHCTSLTVSGVLVPDMYIFLLSTISLP